MDADPISLSGVFKHHCPACHKGSIYDGLLRLKPACGHCGYDMRHADAGDGPAFFAITIVGTLITILAAYVENRYQPSYWLHIALWLPLTVLLCLYLLRLVKTYLVHLKHHVHHTNTEGNV